MRLAAPILILALAACTDAKPPQTGDLPSQRDVMVETQIAARGITVGR